MMAMDTKMKTFERTVLHHKYLSGCVLEVQQAVSEASVLQKFSVYFRYSLTMQDKEINKILISYLKHKKYRITNVSGVGFKISWKY